MYCWREDVVEPPRPVFRAAIWEKALLHTLRGETPFWMVAGVEDDLNPSRETIVYPVGLPYLSLRQQPVWLKKPSIPRGGTKFLTTVNEAGKSILSTSHTNAVRNIKKGWKKFEWRWDRMSFSIIMSNYNHQTHCQRIMLPSLSPVARTLLIKW